MQILPFYFHLCCSSVHPPSFDGGWPLGCILGPSWSWSASVRKIVIPGSLWRGTAVATNQPSKSAWECSMWSERPLDDLSFSHRQTWAMEPLWKVLDDARRSYIFLLSGAAGAFATEFQSLLDASVSGTTNLAAILIGVFNSFGGLTSIGIARARNLSTLEIAPLIDFKRYLFMKFCCSIWCNPSFLFFLVGVCLYFVHPWLS